MSNHSLWKSSLIEAYNSHAQERDASTAEAWKLEERANFLRLLQSKGKRSLLEIGAGTGRDSKFFQDEGLLVTCIDLSPEMVKFCRQKGLSAYIMDMTHLGFPSASFEAVYALNSLLHIPNAEFRSVLQNIHRVLTPTGLFYLGIYGADEEFEGVWENDSYTPKRFFSFKTDETMQKTTSDVFKPLYFKRIATSGKQLLHFQSLLLEKPGIEKQ